MLSSVFQVASFYPRDEKILSFSTWAPLPQLGWSPESALTVQNASCVKGGEQAPLGCSSAHLV